MGKRSKEQNRRRRRKFGALVYRHEPEEEKVMRSLGGRDERSALVFRSGYRNSDWRPNGQ